MSSWEAFLLDLLDRSYCWRQFGFSHKVVSDSCDPMNCSLPGSSVHGILQARILEWVPISFFISHLEKQYNNISVSQKMQYSEHALCISVGHS